MPLAWVTSAPAAVAQLEPGALRKVQPCSNLVAGLTKRGLTGRDGDMLGSRGKAEPRQNAGNA